MKEFSIVEKSGRFPGLWFRGRWINNNRPCVTFFFSPYLYNSASRFIALPLLLTTSSGHRDLEYPGRSGRMQIDRSLRRNRTWFDLKTRGEGGGRGTETRDGTTSSISFVPLSSSISNRSQDEYRIDAARTSSRRSGFTLQGVTRGRETKREREREGLYTRFPINLNACSSGDSARYRLVDSPIRSLITRIYMVHEIIRRWTQEVVRPLETTVTALGSHDLLLTIAREMRPRTNRWMQMDEIEEGIEGIESKDLEGETVEGRRWGERVSVYRVFIFHVFLFRLLLYQTFLSLSLSLLKF